MSDREVTMILKLDTRQFDRSLRRVRRRLWVTRIRANLFWLWTYAVVVTAVAITLAVSR